MGPDLEYLYDKNKATIQKISPADFWMTPGNKTVRELELLAVVWWLENFRFYLYGIVVYIYAENQALESIVKRNRAHQENNARLKRWLDKLAHFEISIQNTAGSNSELMDFLSQHSTKKHQSRKTTQKKMLSLLLQNFLNW